MNRRAPEPELCHFYDGSAALEKSADRVNQTLVTIRQFGHHCAQTEFC